MWLTRSLSSYLSLNYRSNQTNMDVEAQYLDLGCSTLLGRRSCQKLCLCRCILTGGSLIPDWMFSLHTSPCLRLMNSCLLLQASAKQSTILTLCSWLLFHYGMLFLIKVSLNSNLVFKKTPKIIFSASFLGFYGFTVSPNTTLSLFYCIYFSSCFSSLFCSLGWLNTN